MTTKHCKYKRAELEKYCNDKYGYVKCVTQPMHIGLPPWGLTKIKETVRDTVLEEKFGHFDAKLGGIVLDIRNITILGNKYPVHNDSSAVHVSLNVNFYVFQPCEGVIVKGIIKHIAFHHISATIHRFFNVSIPMEKKNHNLEIDMEVNVRLTKLDFEDSIPYFEGELELPIGRARKANSTDSGICTNGEKAKLMKTKNGKNSSDSDEDSSSDSDDDTSGDSSSHSDDIDFTKIKVKEEPESSSKSFSTNDSDSEDKSTSCGGKTSLMKVAIKRETSSSTSSSSSDAESLSENVKNVKFSSIQLGKRKLQSTRNEPKIKKEMSFLLSEEMESTKLTMTNTQNDTISSKKKVKKEKASSSSHQTNATQSGKVKIIQDELILPVEKVKRMKNRPADAQIDETNLSPEPSSALLKKKHKKKSKELPYESSNEVSSTRSQPFSNIQLEPILPAEKVKKEKSSSNDETNFSPGLSSTLLIKNKHKKKSSKEETSQSSIKINSTPCQNISNILNDGPILSVKRERLLSLSSSSSDNETDFFGLSSKPKKKPSKSTEYLTGLLRNKNKT